MPQPELKIVNVNTSAQVQEVMFRSDDGKAHGVIYFDDPTLHAQIAEGGVLPLTLNSPSAAPTVSATVVPSTEPKRPEK